MDSLSNNKLKKGTIVQRMSEIWKIWLTADLPSSQSLCRLIVNSLKINMITSQYALRNWTNSSNWNFNHWIYSDFNKKLWQEKTKQFYSKQNRIRFKTFDETKSEIRKHSEYWNVSKSIKTASQLWTPNTTHTISNHQSFQLFKWFIHRSRSAVPKKPRTSVWCSQRFLTFQ
jgi:hypothetical protein